MIRKAIPADASRLAEILVFAKRTAYRPIFQNDAVSFNEIQVLPLAEELRDRPGRLEGIYVYDDGIVKGLLHRQPGADGKTWQLNELYVDPFFQGEGIGGQLISHFLSAARQAGAQQVFLWVLEKNLRAKAFYESHGFSFDGVRMPEEGTPELLQRYVRPL